MKFPFLLLGNLKQKPLKIHNKILKPSIPVKLLRSTTDKKTNLRSMGYVIQTYVKLPAQISTAYVEFLIPVN